MRKQLGQRPLTVFLIAMCFLITIMGTGITAAMAESSGTTEDRSVFFGKVTAIDGNAVTVAIATVSMPQMPQQNGSANSQSSGQNNAPVATPPADGSGFQGGRMNFADNLTLTGELVTVQVTDHVTLTKQGARPKSNGTDGTPGSATQPGNGQGQGTGSADLTRPDGQRQPLQGQDQGFQGQGMFNFTGEAATISDLAVDCIVVLTYQTSTQQLLSIHILRTPDVPAA